MISRRSLLGGIGAFIVAPAIERIVVFQNGSATGKTEQLTQQILDAGRIERPFIPSRPFTRKST